MKTIDMLNWHMLDWLVLSGVMLAFEAPAVQAAESISSDTVPSASTAQTVQAPVGRYPNFNEQGNFPLNPAGTLCPSEFACVSSTLKSPRLDLLVRKQISDKTYASIGYGSKGLRASLYQELPFNFGAGVSVSDKFPNGIAGLTYDDSGKNRFNEFGLCYFLMSDSVRAAIDSRWILDPIPLEVTFSGNLLYSAKKGVVAKGIGVQASHGPLIGTLGASWAKDKSWKDICTARAGLHAKLGKFGLIGGQVDMAKGKAPAYALTVVKKL